MASRYWTDSNGNACHMLAPDALFYFARVRSRGARRWTLVGGQFRKRERAMQALTRAMMADRNLWRGEACAAYAMYDPSVLWEICRR